MNVRDLGPKLARWIATRRPRTYLFTGWLVFILGCYPGYLNLDSTLQFYTVRTGQFSDYSPMMTAIWSLCEYVIAGPFPMLALQSGLFLFGTFAILSTVVRPRVAAVTASLVMLFPPVFSTLAVIWPDPLMAGALVAATGALLQRTSRWIVASAFLGVLACACRPEAVVAIAVILLAVLAIESRGKRLAVAAGTSLAILLVSFAVNHLATVTDTHVRANELKMMDVVGTLRRAKLKKEDVLKRAVEGMPIADPATFKERLTAYTTANNWWPLAHDDKRVFDIITTDAQDDATSAAWRRVIREHPKAYFNHRFALTRSLLGFRGRPKPVWDDFGSPDLLAPLHHRAIPSDWELGMQTIVHGFARTPLFKPWLYLLLAIVVIALARRIALLRNLAIAGLAYQLAMFFCAPGTDYKYAHWMVAAVTIALVGWAVSRRSTWALAND